MTQSALGALMGVTQPTVQRWEKAGMFPAEHQALVRRLAKDRCINWSDSWFFEVPDDSVIAGRTALVAETIQRGQP